MEHPLRLLRRWRLPWRGPRWERRVLDFGSVVLRFTS
jgi:hypothetical protein